MGVIKLIDTRFITVEEHTGVDHIIYHHQILYITPHATTAGEQLCPGAE